MTPDISISDVDISMELEHRPTRRPNFEGESRALLEVAETATASPSVLLQLLSEHVLALANADSAGVSILTELDGKIVFRWAGLAGALIGQAGTLHRDTSPCGVTIKKNREVLLDRPSRAFADIPSSPPIFEALLHPFHFENKPVGTVWAVAHQASRKFDREDARIIGSLARLASLGYTEAQHKQRLVDLNNRLESEAAERSRIEQQLRKTLEDLEKRNSDLETFSDVVVGRELKMIEMKKEIEELKKRLGAQQ